MGIKSLLIANRGEIAVRIIRAARDMGIRTIQAYSEADSESLPVQLADDSILIGAPHATKSYLNIHSLVTAAAESGADAVHPGYGFLAENGDFADAVESAGLIFIGPKGKIIRELGDKVTARSVATAVGLATVPGSERRIEDLDSAKSILEQVGFPVLIKATAGGGGRGIRIAHDQAEFDKLAPQASVEALAAFGDGGIYIESYIDNARHVEVQIVGDGNSALHFYDRECSLQRRRQKIWEEAPASCLSEETRERLCGAAREFASSVGYRGAGTLEFLYDSATENFYFLEMNTRIQVEHPVTECITGVDLVRESIRVADGAALDRKQSEIRIRGHAIECRINAEDPCNGFMPSPGQITHYSAPGGPGVRFDSMLYPGYTVPPFYDSLLGKLIVWGENRSEALEKMKGALGELEIKGIETTKSLHQALLNDKNVIEGSVHTTFLDDWLSKANLKAQR